MDEAHKIGTRHKGVHSTEANTALLMFLSEVSSNSQADFNAVVLYYLAPNFVCGQ